MFILKYKILFVASSKIFETIMARPVLFTLIFDGLPHRARFTYTRTCIKIVIEFLLASNLYTTSAHD